MKSRRSEKFGYKKKSGTLFRQADPEFVINAILMSYRQRTKFFHHFAPEEGGRLTDNAMMDERLKRPVFGRILFNDSPMFIDVVSSSVNDVSLRVQLKKLQYA